MERLVHKTLDSLRIHKSTLHKVRIKHDLLKENTNLKNENDVLRKIDFNREERFKLLEFKIGVLEDRVVETKRTDADMTLYPKNRLNRRRNLSSWRNRDSTHLTTQNNIPADFRNKKDKHERHHFSSASAPSTCLSLETSSDKGSEAGEGESPALLGSVTAALTTPASSPSSTRAWLYLGRAPQGTTSEKIISFMKGEFPDETSYLVPQGRGNC
ncbi:hypothetical protein HHI36_005305 [Cryptolaemus montrouzieri]|uniref:Uncharacterized protein n=1 Tax=Cryptolaemus montrouzieri TaxID=559131 RepID=A0ABD2NU79_9CUCU